jgi:DNA polymerase-3 subunit epsilon
MRFEGINTSIHGIRPEDVADKPEFPEVLAEYLPELTGSLVLAHNAAFDISVMRATLDKYNRPYPEFTYLCTAKLARKVWPTLPSSTLDTVAHHLGIKFEHHHAASDAAACAEIALAASRILRTTTIEEVTQSVSISLGRLEASGYAPCSIADHKTSKKLSTIAPTREDWDDQHPLCRKAVVFTGRLGLMSRSEAAQLVVNLGGIVHDHLKRSTNYLVISKEAHDEVMKSGRASNKTRGALEMIAHGLPIEIISEEEFYRLCL